eukprot:COSAG04_NODE_2506_length_3995_cov_1.565708_8_plen_38_part_01
MQPELPASSDLKEATAQIGAENARRGGGFGGMSDGDES